MKKIWFPSLLSLLILVSCVTPETASIPTDIRTDVPTSVPTISEVLPPTTMNEPLIGDGGLISAQPCSWPCFFGIRLGETRLEQVIPMLEENLSSTCVQDDKMRIKCDHSVIIWVNQSTTIVDTIGFDPSETIVVQDIIDKYGEPDLVQPIPGGIPEAPMTTMLLFFDSIRMRVHLPSIDGEEYPISDQTEVEWVTYLDEPLYLDLRANSYSQPWAGYDTYMPDKDQ